jgi:hypothetical protein
VVLYKILSNELLSKGLTVLTNEEVVEISKYVNNILTWCLNFEVVICEEFIKVLDKFINSLTMLRCMKFLTYDGELRGSVDSTLLGGLVGIAKDYYKVLMYGLVDSGGNVVVRVLKDLEYGGVKYCRRSITSIPLRDALLLSRLGYVEVLDDLII